MVGKLNSSSQSVCPRVHAEEKPLGETGANKGGGAVLSSLDRDEGNNGTSGQISGSDNTNSGVNVQIRPSFYCDSWHNL